MDAGNRATAAHQTDPETSGTALSRPLEDEPVPASAAHTFRNWSLKARWPRLLDGEPPGSDQDALA